MKKTVTLILTVLIVLMSALPASAIDPTSITVYLGDTYGISCDAAIDVEGVYWECSDPTVAEIIGTVDRTRSVHTLKTGTATIKVCQADGTVIQSSTLNVINKPTLEASRTYFKQDSPLKYIDRNCLGEHLMSNTAYSETQQFIEENIKFGSARVAFNPDDTVTDYVKYAKDFLTPIKRNNMTIVVILSRFKKTDSVETLEEQAKAIYDELKGHQSDVYFEFGNEMYSHCADETFREEYLEKCKGLYPKVKAFGDNVHVGIPVYGELKNGEWYDNNIAKISDYFDAIVPHLYSSMWKYDGISDSSYMRRIHTSNRNNSATIKDLKIKFPGKELWVTEFGHMDFAMFNARGNAEEMARLQNSKTVAAAIGNIDKFLEYLVEDSIKFAHYHTPNDAEGFGMVQGMNKLPNYYPFKKLSDIMDECNTVSLLGAEGRTELKKELTVVGNVPILSQEGYVFGIGNNARYAVFINRDERECNVSLDGQQLKKSWQYTSDNVAGEHFLRGTAKYTSVPENVPVPTVFNDTQYADTVTLAPNSITVCYVPFENYSIDVYRKTDKFELPLNYASAGDAFVRITSDLIGDTEAVLAEYSSDFKTLNSVRKINVGEENKVSFKANSAYKVILVDNFNDITPLCETYTLKAVSDEESVSSPMNNMGGVPIDRAIPITFTGGAALTADDISVISSKGESLTGYTLTGSDSEYELEFEDVLDCATGYTVYTPFGDISFVTEYDTSSIKLRPTLYNLADKEKVFNAEKSEISMKININGDPTANLNVTLSNPNDTDIAPTLAIVFTKTPDGTGKRALQARYSDKLYANGTWNVGGDSNKIYWEVNDTLNVTLSDYTVYFHLYDENGVHKASYSKALSTLVQGDRIKKNNIKFSKYKADSIYYQTDIGFGTK